MSKDHNVVRPWCPFCGQTVGKPSHAPERRMNEFPVGRCLCGAVYTCDVTGHNVGAAIVETLVYACNDNPDLAWELLPEDDYLTGRIENYDEEHNQVVAKKNVDGRAVRGVLYFVRLHTDMQDIAKRIKDKQEAALQEILPDLKKEKSVTVEPVPDKARVRRKASKPLVKQYVEEGNIDELVGLCLDDKKTLRLMQRLLYAPDEAKRWHIAYVIGKVCERVSTREPGSVSELLHRLFEACSDSAATPWGMVETIGYVISLRPDIFGAFSRYLLNYIGEPSTRNQTIWGLAEIAGDRPDLIRKTPFYNLFHFLQHPEAQVRGQVVRLLGRIKASEAAVQIMGLTNDKEEFLYCVDGKLVTTTVSEQAAIAMQAIHEGKTNE
ncbi:DVU0298 family protein [Desulforhopalus sp. IMCC35007]|uniref:DVU0298 family protein n=1 Tax=Desulforhopalus sp. IMCC35007 TaxID=2569543 RepID=UPI0010AED61A|nr:DVU0298 family protein [Desulforhopalus sp. IMCC35007]TKB08746.1 PBS lyase [Desulforhopalus sp. IMCC35007]